MKGWLKLVVYTLCIINVFGRFRFRREDLPWNRNLRARKWQKLLPVFKWKRQHNQFTTQSPGKYVCEPPTNYAVFPDKLMCSSKLSCEYCEFIDCNKCEQFACNGVSQCQDATIDIDGIDAGALMVCNQFNACYNATIKGQNMNELKCFGIQSCQSTNIHFVSRENYPGRIICNGTNACSHSTIYAEYLKELTCVNVSCVTANIDIDGVSTGAKILCTGNNACRGSSIVANNVSTLVCEGDTSCGNNIFRLHGHESIGTVVKCNSNACINANIEVDQTSIVECDGAQSCFSQTVHVTAFDDTFMYNCNGEHSCAQSDIIINIPDHINEIKSIKCVGLGACQNTRFTVIAGTQTKILDIECSGMDACSNSKWELDNIDASLSGCDEMGVCLGIQIDHLHI